MGLGGKKLVFFFLLVMSPSLYGICESVGGPIIAAFDPFAVAISAHEVTAAEVACIYTDGLGRSAAQVTQAEIDSWVLNSKAYKKGFEVLKREMTRGPEGVALVQKYYREELGREGTPAEINPWVDQLAILGAKTVKDAIHNSPEGQLRQTSLTQEQVPSYFTVSVPVVSGDGTAPTCEKAYEFCMVNCSSQTNRQMACLGDCLSRSVPQLCGNSTGD